MTEQDENQVEGQVEDEESDVEAHRFEDGLGRSSEGSEERGRLEESG